MKKKLKFKKNLKVNKIITTTIYIIIFIIIITLLNYFSKLKIIDIDIKEILKQSNNYNGQNYIENIQKISNQIIGIDINKPTTILKNMNVYMTSNKKEEPKIFYIEKQPHDYSNKEPLVYIYNTHQTEQYQTSPIINLTPDVMQASYYLENKFEKMGINTIVEEANISRILKENNWNYNQSYKASRINLEKIKNQYPSIKIFIDLHRDAVSKQTSTVSINNKNYAKVLFVIGKEHNNYQKNFEFTASINNLIINKYPELTRGIMQKEGIGVNGIYNQDISENVILLEVGGNNNSMDEVINTLDLISEIIKEKINEN